MYTHTHMYYLPQNLLLDALGIRSAVLVWALFYLVIVPKCKSNDAGNSVMPESGSILQVKR